MMLLSATRPNTQRRKVSKQVSLPAPTNGWYVGENIATAPPKTAFILDNWFPSQDNVRIRRGSTEYATGLGSGDVRQIITYDASGSTYEFGCANGNVYEFTGGGAAISMVSGLGSDDWQSVQFTTTAGTYIRMANGEDTPLIFDGSTWGTTPAITGSGLTDTKLCAVWSFKNRIYFIEKNSMNAWYLGLDSIGGTATKLNLGGFFSHGGALLVGASWSISSNSGLYETCVFVTDRGEVAMFDGSYPGDTAWTLKGLYKISRPLGRDCIMKAGGDLAIMTEDGIVPMSKVMTLDRIALANEAITKPIAPKWREAVQDRDGLSGWSITLWPRESMAIVNMPQTASGDPQQFIANARSGAWCRYTGWDAKCFAVSGDMLLFGTSDGRIIRAEHGGDDDGELYSGKCFWSWTDLGRAALRKHIKAARMVYIAGYDLRPYVEVKSDFNATTSPAPSAYSNANVALWDSALWDVAVWPGGSDLQAKWQTVTGFGAVVAPVAQVSISMGQNPDLRLMQIDIVYEDGEALG